MAQENKINNALETLHAIDAFLRKWKLNHVPIEEYIALQNQVDATLALLLSLPSVEHGDMVDKLIKSIMNLPEPVCGTSALWEDVYAARHKSAVKWALYALKHYPQASLPTPSITPSHEAALARVKELEAMLGCENYDYERTWTINWLKGYIKIPHEVMARLRMVWEAELEAKPTIPMMSEDDLIEIMNNVQAGLPQTWGELDNYHREISRAFLASGVIAKTGR